MVIWHDVIKTMQNGIFCVFFKNANLFLSNNPKTD